MKHHFVCLKSKPFYVIYHSFPFPNKYYDVTRIVVNMDKPRNLGLWFMVLGLLLIMFYLNTVDCVVFFLSLPTWTWETFSTLRDTWGFYLNYILPPKPSERYGVVVGWAAYKILETPQVLGLLWSWTWACQQESTSG